MTDLDPEQAFRAHHGFVMDYFLSRLRYRHALAEDLASEAWVKIIKSADTYQERGTLLRWIKTVCRSVYADYVRGLPKASEVALEDSVGHPSLSYDLKLDPRFEYGMGVADMLALLDDHPKYRDVLRLIYQEGMQPVEIYTRNGWTKRSLQSAQRNGLELLHRRLFGTNRPGACRLGSRTR